MATMEELYRAAGLPEETWNPYMGMPQMPAITSLLDANGMLNGKYQIARQRDPAFRSNLADLDAQLGGINLNTEALQALRKRALSSGPSEWAGLQEQKQRLEEQNALANAARSAGAASSYGFSEAARRGGLSSGARERLAEGASRNLASGQQEILRGGMGQRLDIGLQDELQRLDLLKSLPGMEVQALNPALTKAQLRSGVAESEAGRGQNLDLANRQYGTEIDKLNKQGAMLEIARQDAAKLAGYQEKMKTFAADKTAQAQANAGKK